MNTALVISSPGYDLFVYQLMTQNLEGKRIICKLHSKKNIVQNRLSASDPLHKIRLNAFFQNLLGISEEASKCIVSNKSVVYFVMGENKLSSSAFADSPIVIINTMLGYKISFNLEDFIYDELTGENYLVGYSHFE